MNQLETSKQYKAVFFDWDGTAVISRRAPADEAAAVMRPLLERGIKLIIVSGTTYENIAGGELHRFFTPGQLENLWLGLGRGAYNYRYHEDGSPYVFKDCVPDAAGLLAIHDTAYDIHRTLMERHGFPTDVVFSRPNYCKIDLMVEISRGDKHFFQANELLQVMQSLEAHGFLEGLSGLVKLSDEIALRHGIKAASTTDAKYLEVGISSKSDNVNTILGQLTKEEIILPEDCVFWGDEYIGLDKGLFGSDSFMITPVTQGGDFFDVSDAPGVRPDNVRLLGGGVNTFLDFLRRQAQF